MKMRPDLVIRMQREASYRYKVVREFMESRPDLTSSQQQIAAKYSAIARECYDALVSGTDECPHPRAGVLAADNCDYAIDWCPDCGAVRRQEPGHDKNGDLESPTTAPYGEWMSPGPEAGLW